MTPRTYKSLLRSLSKHKAQKTPRTGSPHQERKLCWGENQSRLPSFRGLSKRVHWFILLDAPSLLSNFRLVLIAFVYFLFARSYSNATVLSSENMELTEEGKEHIRTEKKQIVICAGRGENYARAPASRRAKP